MHEKVYRSLLLLLCTLGLAAPFAGAQEYPSRPVRIIVPLAAGGGMDTVTRALALKVGAAFRETIVVDNRPGAGSQIGLEILASSDPDGYTLMMISATTVIHPLLYGSRFDIVRDFVPVSQVTEQGYALVLHPSIPASSVSEFVQYLKANPGKLNYASSGIGSPIHMTTELFLITTGTRMTHVPFKGMGTAYADLVAGRIEASFATVISSLVHVKAGRLRLLAVSPDKRVPALPDTPTLKQAGVDVAVVNWYGLIAPKGTPSGLVQRVAAASAKAVNAPDMAARLTAEGSEAVGSSPKQFAARLREERDQWARVIKQANIKGR